MPYLDHTGAALPSEEQLKQIGELLTKQRLSNPHSHHSTSTTTKQIVDNARQRILSHFNANDYSIIFTYNTTHSLKIIAESYVFPPKAANSCEIVDSLQSECSLAYLADSHHSVVGMREIARSKVDYISCLSAPPSKITVSNRSLFVLTAMSNFCGFKYDLSLVGDLQEKGWSVCLDAAALVSSSPLDLSKIQPDFVAISFYKMLGYPTGLGALLVKKAPQNFRNLTLEEGQLVPFCPANLWFAIGRAWKSSELTSNFYKKVRFEDGTINYYAVASLQKGFDDLERFGGINQIQKHSFQVAEEAKKMLEAKFHWNGKPAIRIYRKGKGLESQGPVLTFNVLREDESFFGYAEVAKMADLFGIDLRTGCFCNIGACQIYLGLTDEEILSNVKFGKLCGDEQDILNGKPTGAVRISFGRQSCLEDVRALEQMIDYCFLGERFAPILPLPMKLSSYSPILSQLLVYPVKSLRGISLDRALLKQSGLLHDRQFMIVNNEVTMSQKKFPQLCQISTRIEGNALALSHQNREISIPLGLSPKLNRIGKIVCSTSVATVDCGEKVANWLSKSLEIPNCRLQSITEDSEKSLSNQAPFLLANESSAQVMATQIGLSLDDVIIRFRPNLVLKGLPAFIEDSLSRFSIGRADFEVIDKCTRCEMICVDQKTGEKDPKVIVALRDLRDRQKMTFGIYVRQINYKEEELQLGDLITFPE